MALVQATLASALTTALDPAGTTDSIITASDFPTRIAQAYGHYMKDAAALTPIIAAAIDSTATPAMAGAMSFPHGSAAAGAVNLAAGYSAFWAAMAAAPALFFAAAIAILPPTFAALASAFEAQFAVNNNPSITTAQAASNLASAIHPNTLITPTATTPGGPPVVTPIT